MSEYGQMANANAQMASPAAATAWLDAARAKAQGDGLFALGNVAQGAWHTLALNALEPNGYYLPEWARAVSASARDRMDGQALAIWNDEPARQLAGLIPVIPFQRAYGLPLPVLVSFDAYGPLGTPLIGRGNPDETAGRLMARARDAGAHALLLRDIPIHGPTTAAFTRVLGWSGQRPRFLRTYARAMLDATRDADALLQEALGGKKIKELRRQRNRLAEQGAVTFAVAKGRAAVEAALEDFLALEASGWKGRRGTAIANDAGDVAFLRSATAQLAANGQCEIVTLSAGQTPVASGVVLRHCDRAFYFKLGVDERFAKCSPGVQLTLELTRHLCADPVIASADSTAIPNHPMIDPIWRGRLAIGDMLIPLRKHDPIVPLTQAALVARETARNTLRPLAHFVHDLRDKNR